MRAHPTSAIGVVAELFRAEDRFVGETNPENFGYGARPRRSQVRSARRRGERATRHVRSLPAHCSRGRRRSAFHAERLCAGSVATARWAAGADTNLAVLMSGNA